MKIPVFISRPSDLSKDQEESFSLIKRQLTSLSLEERRLGQSDYPSESPLKEVYTFAKHCSGGIILGYTQFTAKEGVYKPNTTKQKDIRDVSYPTAWNNLEAGILFSLKLPLLIFKDSKIEGGVFDPGVTDVFIHTMPYPPLSGRARLELREIMLKWSSKVRDHYYSY